MRETGAYLTLSFLTGLTTLVFEVVWFRHLALLLGSGAYAAPVVLSVFMLGLGFGGMLCGKRVDRVPGSLLTLYGSLALLVALYAMAVPALSAGVELFFGVLHQAAYAWNILLRMGLSMLLLLVPTLLLGAMFPVMVKLMTAGREHNATYRIGLAYGVNALGGMVGLWLAVYCLIPVLGVSRTGWLAILVNVAVWIVALLIRKSLAAPPADETTGPAAVPPHVVEAVPVSPQGMAFIAFMTGFLVMGLELLVIRLVGTALVNTIYHFTLVVIVFLLLLSSGAVAGGIVGRRWNVRLGWFFLAGATGLLVTLPFWDGLSIAVCRVARAFGDQFQLLQAAEGVIILSLVAVPVAALGMIFPIICARYASAWEERGMKAGTIYLANCLGAACGPLCFGLVILWFASLREALLMVFALLGVCGVLALRLERAITRHQAQVGAWAVLVLAVIFYNVLVWDDDFIYGGFLQYALKSNYPDVSEMVNAFGHDSKIVFVANDPVSTIAVRQTRDILTMRINGTAESSSPGTPGFANVIMLGHLPQLLAPARGRTLLIGLGGGNSLHAMLQHPVAHVDVLEISPAVLACERRFPYADEIAADSRVDIIVDDGRDYLKFSERRYDVIAVNVSNPWVPGSAYLYTREFYELAQSKLAANGLLIAWCALSDLTPETLHGVINGFTATFDGASLWAFEAGSMMLVGMNGGTVIDVAALRERCAEPAVQKDLAAIGVTDPAQVLAGFIAADSQLREIGAGVAPNRDDLPVTEFITPTNLMRTRLEPPLMSLMKDAGIYRQYATLPVAPGSISLERIFNFRHDAEAGWEPLGEAVTVSRSGTAQVPADLGKAVVRTELVFASDAGEVIGFIRYTGRWSIADRLLEEGIDPRPVSVQLFTEAGLTGEWSIIAAGNGRVFYLRLYDKATDSTTFARYGFGAAFGDTDGVVNRFIKGLHLV